MDLASVLPTILTWKQTRDTIVLVTGVFDLLHIEHIRFLTKARASGDRLVVGVESDLLVRQLKGEGRPVHTAAVRVEQLLALRSVDAAFILPEDFSTQDAWESLMRDVSPDIYAVSSHTDWLDNKRAIAEKYGARLAIVHDFNSQYSTSAVHQKILDLQ